MSGFIYVWYDRKHKRYYVGSHWGTETDNYICSSNWMYNTWKRRSQDFKRRIVARISTSRKDLLNEEQRWLDMIKITEIKPVNPDPRYYNLNISVLNPWWSDEDAKKSIGEKISAAKTGKSTGPCSPEKALAISEAKKRKFAERKATLGYTRTPEQVERHRQAIIGKEHTPEWKVAQSERVRQQWADGKRSKEAASERMRIKNPNR